MDTFDILTLILGAFIIASLIVAIVKKSWTIITTLTSVLVLAAVALLVWTIVNYVVKARSQPQPTLG